MSIIDDEGNLFGRVNVIDALAVVLLLAVVIAGVAVVGVLSSGGEPETRYATVELDTQPAYVVDNIEEGDNLAAEDASGNLTVTDIYVTATDDGVQLTVRTEVEGELIDNDGESRFTFDNDLLRPGDELSLETSDFVTTGQVTKVEEAGSELPRETESVLLETTVSSTTADEITEGDAIDVGSRTIATVTNVQSYPVDGEQRRVYVGVELETIIDGTTPMFAGERVTVDRQVSLTTSSYDFTGDVVRRGATEPAGEQREATAEVKLENVDPDVADSLQEGMTENNRGEIDATIENIETQPAEVVLESDDGNIYLREHPKNKDVRLTVTLQTVTTDSGVRFHGESLRENDDIVLDFDTVFVDGTVTNLELED